MRRSGASPLVASAGLERPRGTPMERLRWIASHEAGHAVVAWHCPVINRVVHMVIEPTTGGGALWSGHVSHDWSREAPVDQRLAWDVVIALSGLAAEILCYGELRTLVMQDQRDVMDAVRAARAMCERRDPWPLPSNGQPLPALPFAVECSREEWFVLCQAWATARTILESQRDPHAMLASAIVERRRLGEWELAAILGPRS
jgi:hypothetical protein